MILTTAPGQGLLFFSFLYRRDLFEKDLFLNRTQNFFGKLITFSPIHNPLINYYAKEMGDASLLDRHFFLTTTAFPREFLLTTKLLAIDWEREWRHNQARQVNVDIGFLSLENFILATTKNYSHRVFLGQNIFADLTYQAVDGRFQTLPWTYPDYIDQEKIDFFNWSRSFLLMQSKL